MKTLIFFLSIMSLSASAAQISLNGGDEIVIQANTKTKVSCGASAVSECDKAVEAFDTIMSYCKKSYTDSYCFGQYWVEFKQENPNCIRNAVNSCFSYCTKTYSNSYCLGQCQ